MTNNLFDLTGEVAIVTGGAKGIGKGIAKGLAEYGAKVVIFDIDAESANETVEEIKKMGGYAVFKKVDVTKTDEVNKAVSEVLDEFGKIDILVNNAGTVVRKSVLDTTDQDWDKVINLNLKGAFLCARAVGPSMIKRRKGKIINIGSVSSFLGHPDHAAYGASKGGIRILTKVLAVEWGKYGINVNGIAPGYVKTPMTEDYLRVKRNYESIVSKIPLNRVAVPEDLIGPVVFLASKASDYISGHMLLVDGGRTAD